jgi:transposase
MGNTVSNASTVVSTSRSVNRSMKDVNKAFTIDTKSQGCRDQKELKIRRKQREEEYKQRVKERQERKAKILEKFIVNQRVHASRSDAVAPPLSVGA